MKKKIIIIGGGIGGLSCATSLAETGNFDISIYESDIIGGQASSQKSELCNTEISWRVFGAYYSNLYSIMHSLGVFNLMYESLYGHQCVNDNQIGDAHSLIIDHNITHINKIATILFFLKYEHQNKSLLNIFLVTFFVALASYLRPIYCIFNIYFFLKFLLDNKLNKNLLLVYTGIRRTAHDIARGYVNKLNKSKKSHILHISSFVEEAEKTLRKGNVSNFGNLLLESWLEKKNLSSAITNSSIDEIYNNAIKKGALGGKLLGAGGGGFFLFYVPYFRQKNFIKYFRKLITIPFKFSSEGSKILFKSIDNKII